MCRVLASLTLLFVAATAMPEDSKIYTDRQFSFPDGRTKALVLSYDDGPTQDIRLIQLLNKHGIKGTFYINSGRLGMRAEWMAELIGDPGWYVTAEDLQTVYDGHEIASHTVNHPHLPGLESSKIREEIVRDIEVLQQLSGEPVESFAYTFGEFDDRIVDILQETTITNARTVESTGTFALPEDFLRWHPTAHHSEALPIVEEFLAIDNEAPKLFMLWGHSWEFDGDSPDNNWVLAEALCERLSGHDDIWYAGADEFTRYLMAIRNLQQVDEEWVNRSDIPVWIRQEGRLTVLPSRQL